MSILYVTVNYFLVGMIFSTKKQIKYLAQGHKHSDSDESRSGNPLIPSV